MIIRDILLTISILDLSCTAFGRYFLFGVLILTKNTINVIINLIKLMILEGEIHD